MCNIIRRFFGINTFARFNNEIELRERGVEGGGGAVTIHNIFNAPAENLATNDSSWFQPLVKDKPTPLLQKLLTSRKNKERQLLERHGLSTDEYRVFYNPRGDEVEQIALPKADFYRKANVSATIYAEALRELKKAEEEDKKRTLDGFIQSCLETMVDGEDERAALAARLRDGAISSVNFLNFSELTDDSLFQAHFQDARLTLSNRAGAVELRGERLREVMGRYDYNTLEDLLSKLYLTEFDHQMAYRVSAIMAVNISARCQEYDLSEEQTNNMKRKFEGVKFRGVPLINLIPHYFLYD